VPRAAAHPRRTKLTARGDGLDGVVDAHRRRMPQHGIAEKPALLVEHVDLRVREHEVRGHVSPPASILGFLLAQGIAMP
jgi:hypothetical protein